MDKIEIKVSIVENLPRVMLGNIDLTPGLLVIGYAIRDRTNVYPPKRGNRKVQWASERQRRYVLATGRVPYVRRGYLAKQWTVTPASKARVVVRNAAPYARYVIGERQQNFHAELGWRKVNDIAKEVARDLALMSEVAQVIKGKLR
jgi:hypothetical protein